MKQITKNLTLGLLALIVFLSIQAYSRKAPSFTTKLSPSVENFTRSATNDQRFPILITMKEQADLSGADKISSRDEKGKYVYNQLRTVAMKTQGDLVSFLKSQNVQFQQFYIYNMVSVMGASSSLIEQIKNRSDVAKVSGNPAVKNNLFPFTLDSIDLETTPPSSGIENSILVTGAPRVWSDLKVTGAGITVAGQDTGVQWDHPALKTHYRGYSATGVDHAYNWHDSIHIGITAGDNPCGFNSLVPCDDDEHGTHTMGTMIGDDGSDKQIGMAPGAKWMACRNMDRGTGRPTTYIECFEFFLAPYPQGGNAMTDGDPTKSPNIVNNSWGCPAEEGCEGTEMIPVLQAMSKAGIMIVASAGNDGPQCSTIKDQPAQVSGLTLSVGAYDAISGEIASFSSRGPSALDGHPGPDVAAPGVAVTSSVPGNKYAGGFMWSGTSMAGPHVVGEVALLWSAKPSLIGKISETIDIIRHSSTPKQTTENCGGVRGTETPNNTYGYGEIDAYKAVSSQL